MKSPRDIVNECASAVHEAVLKPLGYRKSGLNYVLASEWTRLINIQLSRWNSADDVQFTLNFGVFIEQLHQLAERPAPPQVLREPDCIVRARYGSLTPSQLDHWWKVNSQTDVPELIRDVTGALVSYGLPWLNSLTSYTSVAAEYERQKDMFTASLAYYLAGEPGLARDRMKLALAKANTLFKPRAERTRLPLNSTRTKANAHQARAVHRARLCLVAVIAMSSCVAAQAGLFSFFPKPMLQVPPELRGDDRLRLRMNPDNTRQQFTNAPPFATISSDQVVFAEGQVRKVESLLRVRQKGTNVYMVSFQDESSWLITPTTSPAGLVVVEPNAPRAKEGTIFFLELSPKTTSRTNAPPPKALVPKERSVSGARRQYVGVAVWHSYETLGQ